LAGSWQGGKDKKAGKSNRATVSSLISSPGSAGLAGFVDRGAGNRRERALRLTSGAESVLAPSASNLALVKLIYHRPQSGSRNILTKPPANRPDLKPF
jgi:hypothetical protein